MTAETEIRRGRHCVFNLHVHLVFVTKYRRHVFDGPAVERLREIFDAVCRDFEARLVEMDGEEDHVHLLVEYPPKVSVSGLVTSLKGVSSRLLRRDRRDIEAVLEGGAVEPELLRRVLRRRPDRHRTAVHRAAAATGLTGRAGHRAPLPRGRYPSPP